MGKAMTVSGRANGSLLYAGPVRECRQRTDWGAGKGAEQRTRITWCEEKEKEEQ